MEAEQSVESSDTNRSDGFYNCRPYRISCAQYKDWICLVGRSVSKDPNYQMMTCRKRPERALLEEAHSCAVPGFPGPAIGRASVPEGIGAGIEEPRNSLVFTA